MANFAWNVTLLDAAGNPGNTGGYFVAADQAGAIAYLQGIIEAMNDPTPAGAGALPLTLGIVQSVSLTQNVDFSTWAIRPTADALAENQKGGRFIFKSAFGRAQMTLPTFNEALKNSDGSLDIANLAMISFFDTGVIDGGGSDNHYDDLTALLEAYMTYGGKDARK